MKHAERNSFFKATWLILAIVAIIPAGCKEDDDQGDIGNPDPSGNEYVNSWIQDNMKIYYLWTDDIPPNPNQSLAPDAFFESLLSNEDKFSWIQPDFIELLNSLQGVSKEAGYDFKLYLSGPGSSNVIAQVTYIKTGSLIDTQDKDLHRGDIITHVNETLMTTSNYQELLSGLGENHTIRYSRAGVDKGTLALNTAEFAENPNLLDTIIEVGDHKIAYYVYNFFATGPTSNSNQYNSEMDAIFGRFKSGVITDLVIDLRFNSGGAEGATINLASAICKNINSTVTFTKREYNDALQNELLDAYGAEFFFKKFTNHPQNVGSLLNNGRVYILTSSRTASASELLINGLKPHMEVFLIGDVTVGKNVGSITIYEEEDPNNTWGMQPIVVKSFNSEGRSDYSDGFPPDIAQLDNELDLKPLGDENELLLSLAIEHITGSGSGRKAKANRVQHESIGNSADFKRGGYTLLIDDERLTNFVKSSLVD